MPVEVTPLQTRAKSVSIVSLVLMAKYCLIYVLIFILKGNGLFLDMQYVVFLFDSLHMLTCVRFFCGHDIASFNIQYKIRCLRLVVWYKFDFHTYDILARYAYHETNSHVLR